MKLGCSTEVVHPKCAPSEGLTDPGQLPSTMTDTLAKVKFW